jgi:hypothetical protein
MDKCRGKEFFRKESGRVPGASRRGRAFRSNSSQTATRFAPGFPLQSLTRPRANRNRKKGAAAAGRRLTKRQKAAIRKCQGIAKGVLSSDESLAMRREDLELEEAKSQRPTPVSDRLLGIASGAGDINLDKLRAERLSKYLK